MATRPDSLPTRTARRLHKAASQGQLGKARRQLRAPPPVFVGPDQRNEALAKFTPHEQQEGPPLREDIAPERWVPTPRECDQAISKLKKNTAADAGGWTTETAQSCLNRKRLKQAILQWIHGQAVATEGPARRRALWRTHRLVCLDKGGGHQTHRDWNAVVKATEPFASETGQVRLGSLSPRSTIRHRRRPGGISHDHCVTGTFGRPPLPCSGLLRLQKCIWHHRQGHMHAGSPKTVPT